MIIRATIHGVPKPTIGARGVQFYAPNTIYNTLTSEKYRLGYSIELPFGQVGFFYTTHNQMTRGHRFEIEPIIGGYGPIELNLITHFGEGRTPRTKARTSEPELVLLCEEEMIGGIIVCAIGPIKPVAFDTDEDQFTLRS